MSKDVDLDYIASKTHGFSGADLSFITQRATKTAIKEAIASEVERQREMETSGDSSMEAEYEDPVPELTRAHFEEAMANARRSVSEVEIRRYEAFAQSMKQTSGAGMGQFRFPTAEEVSSGSGGGAGFGQSAEDDDLYS